ncbi:LysM peptidoglycan-binding domain-containing protein [bacterium]|nr:MAG: LysM peptidoglycan-binding domain-containing protein [bacterium]
MSRSTKVFTILSGSKTHRACFACGDKGGNKKQDPSLPKSRTRWAVGFILCIFVSVWPSSALPLNQILSIRHWVAPDHTRVVIDTIDDALFSTEKEDRKIIVNLEDTAFPAHVSPLILINKPGLETVAISSRAPSGVRVELSLPGQVQTTVFKLKRFQDKPYRIVIDIVLPDVAKQESEARERVKIARKDRIVVIDPGHGGEAVGAVGREGTYEKEVALSIGMKLRDILNRRSGYHAFLTRDGDYYVSFNKRRMIAREYGADLFVSIHADAAKNRGAVGSSVYCLSTGAASSEAAKILARSENLADIIGGVPNGEGSDASDPIILDMFQTYTRNQSKTFGGVLLKHLQGVNHLKFTTIQEAPLHVLKLPEIPSVLIETAYISNAKEEKLLRSSPFQARIAEVVAKAVGEFLPLLPSVAESLQKTQVEVIGEIIAAKGAGVSQASDKKENQGVKTPVSEGKGLPADKKGRIIYRVKKGDTLATIAKRHGTTVGTLAKLNRLKLSKPLYVDRKLVIPGKPAL